MKYINLGILAHVDAGKTTLVEQMLFKSGELRAPGSIEKGNTQSDRLAVERERGISVRASSVTLTHAGVRINIIDTPGHIDFTGEAERALSVLDAAVLVVSAAEGVQSQTDIFWRALRALNIPTIIFVNKIDRMGCDPHAVYDALREEFAAAGAAGAAAVGAVATAAAGAAAAGAAAGAATVENNIFSINSAVSPGSRDCKTSEPVYSDDDILALCELDEQIAAEYLENGSAPCTARLTSAIAALSKTSRAFPLLFGSAALGIGVAELLDAIVSCMPAEELSPEGGACGVIYKIEHDASIGKIAYLRLFTGALRNRDAVCFIRRGEFVQAQNGGDPPSTVAINKITQIRRISGARLEDTGELSGGDAAAVIGFIDSRAGDIVIEYNGEKSYNADVDLKSLFMNINPHRTSSLSNPYPTFEERLQQYEKLRLAAPLFAVQVFAGAGQENSLLRAVAELSDEDPLLEYEWEPDERELILRIMGKIQLEIMETLFMERYGLKVSFSPPTVIYKETPKGPGVGFEAYTMPKPCWAVVQLAIAPQPRGAGYAYESVIKANVLPYRYQHHVALTVPQALRQGMYNWEVIDIKVTLIGGEHHHVHTHPMDFFLATPIAVMDALRNAGTSLLEPLTQMRMTTPEELAGRIIGDITAMRGAFDIASARKGNVTIEAILPVSESIEYPARFSSLTSGKGIMRSSFAGYRECPIELGAAAKRRGVNPLDRMRWILYKRNALS